MKRVQVTVGAVVLALASAAAAKAPVEVAPFARPARYADVQISPGGTYLAVLVQDGAAPSLTFLRAATRAHVWRLDGTREAGIGRFRWADDRRVVMSLVSQEGSLAAPSWRGELFAVDADGAAGRMIYGYRAGEQQVGSHLRRAERALGWAHVVARAPHDGRHVLIATTPWHAVDDRCAELERLDVRTGVRDRVGAAPAPRAELLADPAGEARVATGLDDRLHRHTWLRDGEGWKELSGTVLPASAVPLAVGEGGRSVVFDVPAGGAHELRELDPATGVARPLAQGPLPPERLLLDPRTHRVLAAEYEPGKPTWTFVDREHPLARALRAVAAGFPGAHVVFTSTTDDGRLAVARVGSDRDPGQFLLVDTGALSAEPIVDVRPWIDPEAMAGAEPVSIPVRDGTAVPGYFTAPRGVSGAPPLVVLPHGGPHGLRDHWDFDPEVQLLAAAGFAVLRVNYRGSGGYGPSFEAAAHGRWGEVPVDDLIDATRWATGAGRADPARVCVVGASFGAYAALLVAARAPELFRCAVGSSGVYDLALLRRSGDIQEHRLGRGYLDVAVGTDDAALGAGSPVAAAGAIRAAVLLAHGARDRRAPLGQAEAMRAALVAAGRPPEWLVEPLEAHGFQEQGARERFYARLVDFLVRSSGPPQAR